MNRTHSLMSSITCSGRGVKERIVAVVEDRAAAQNCLVAREAPVNRRVNPARINNAHEMIQRDGFSAPELQGVEVVVVRTVLELHSEVVLTLRSLRKLQSNDRSIVSDSGNVRVGNGRVRDVEQGNERLIIDFCQCNLDFVAWQGHVAQRP